VKKQLQLIAESTFSSGEPLIYAIYRYVPFCDTLPDEMALSALS
jgi:hypothetical protein